MGLGTEDMAEADSEGAEAEVMVEAEVTAVDGDFLASFFCCILREYYVVLRIF